jgi:hypothetical protein
MSDAIRIVQTEEMHPEESSHLDAALEIWNQLEKAYPNHPWQVSFQGGALIVKHAVIDALVTTELRRQGFGYLLPKEAMDRHQELVKSAIQAGGAMLELFDLPRGAWDGREPTIPKDWKPKQEAHFA